jgi:hypothetical protein
MSYNILLQSFGRLLLVLKQNETDTIVKQSEYLAIGCYKNVLNL